MPAAKSRWYETVITVAICGYDVPRITTRKPYRDTFAKAKELGPKRHSLRRKMVWTSYFVTGKIWDIPSHGGIGAPGGAQGIPSHSDGMKLRKDQVAS